MNRKLIISFLILAVLSLVVNFIWFGPTAGIIDIDKARKVLISHQKYANILAADDSRSEFALIEIADPSEFILRVIDYEGKERERKTIKVEKRESWYPTDYAFSPDLSKYSLDEEKKIKIYDGTDSQGIEVLTLKNDDGILKMKWFSNQFLIICRQDSQNTSVIKYNIDKKKIIKRAKINDISKVFTLPSSRYVGLVSWPSVDSYDSTLIIFDPDSMKVIDSFKVDTNESFIFGMSVSPSGRRIAYWDKCGILGVVDLDTRQVKKFEQHDVWSLNFLDEDTLIFIQDAFAFGSASVRKFDIKTGNERIIKKVRHATTLMPIDNGRKILYSAR